MAKKTTKNDVISSIEWGWAEGCTVEVSGSMVRGPEFSERIIENASVLRDGNSVRVVGWCPAAKGLRGFRMDHLRVLRVISEPKAGRIPGGGGHIWGDGLWAPE